MHHNPCHFLHLPFLPESSERSRWEAFSVLYINNTPYQVDLVEFECLGSTTKLKTLEPKEYFHVASALRIIRIVLDSQTQMMMDIKFKEVSNFLELLQTEDILVNGMVLSPYGKNKNIVASITLPMFPLREMALQAVQRRLQHRADVFKLKLPPVVQEELYFRCTNTSTAAATATYPGRKF